MTDGEDNASLVGRLEGVSSPNDRSPSPPGSKGFGNHYAPVLRYSAIISCTRTQGRCNQHDMGEGILGQDRCEWTSIPNFFGGRSRKLNDVVLPHVLI